MTSENILNSINRIEKIRESFIQPKKIQLYPCIDGFKTPQAFGIYKHTGGECLGVCKQDYFPIDLNLFLDNIIDSLDKEGGFDLDTLTYNEYKEGRKISIDVFSHDFEVKNKHIGDIFKTSISFTSGFDAKTKTAISFKTLRLTCMNGAKSWKPELSLSFKNTIGNQGKLNLFVKEIAKIKVDMKDYENNLNRIANKQVVQKDVDDLMLALLGYSEKEYKNLKTKQINTLNAINESISKESVDLGMTKYTLLQGVTRYVTHTLGEGDINSVLFDRNADIIQKAHIHLLN